MQVASPRVLVFCPHPGCLQQFAIMLNRLDVFHLSLCASLKEVHAALDSGQRYNLFIFDGFDLPGGDLSALRRLGSRETIEQFLLVGSFSEAQKLEMLRWAWVQRVPLLPMLERPFGPAQLQQALASLVDYSAAGQSAYPRLSLTQAAAVPVVQERLPSAGLAGKLAGAVRRAG